MKKLVFSNEYFNVEDSLKCGQLFRFVKHLNGYFLYVLDKCVFMCNEDKNTIIYCPDQDEEYFYNYFDMKNDYANIYLSAQNTQEEIIKISSKKGKGIRIFNQDKFECIVSFIISQNNNIPRIKGIIEKLCTSLGEKKTFENHTYFAFPTASKMATESIDFYRQIGLGYRAEYVLGFLKLVNSGFDIENLAKLPTEELKERLLKIRGIGPKVADCVTLFAYHKSDSFPVDTWIEKVYRENFNGNIKDRRKISKYFVEKFGNNSGYFQQYLFYYKRSLENRE